MQEPLNNPVAAYIFALLAILPSALDTSTQWYTIQKRSRKYLISRVLPLAIILLIDIGLVVFAEVDRSRQRTDWLPALWALLELSTLLNLSVAAMIYQRACNKLAKYSSFQRWARIQLYSVTAIVLIIDALAFSFTVKGYRPHIAVILQASGSFIAHLCLSILPIWFVSRTLLWNPPFNTSIGGMLGCSYVALAAAVISLAFLGLRSVYQQLLAQSILTFVSVIPLTFLQAYKLVYKPSSLASSENGDLKEAPDIDDPHVPETKAGSQYKIDGSGTLMYIMGSINGSIPINVMRMIELPDGVFELIIRGSSFQELESQLLLMLPDCQLKLCERARK